MRLEDCKTIEDLGAFAIYQRDVIRDLKKERDEFRKSQEHIMYAISFAMEQDQPFYFWEEWNQGEWEMVKKEWPEFDGYLGEG